jgi:excisionase family DNA binding protein
MTEPFIPIEKLAEHFAVSTSTIRSWVRRGDIPASTYIKIGNTYRFSKDAVTTALLNSGVSPPQTANITAESVSAVGEVDEVNETLSDADTDDLDNDM